MYPQKVESCELQVSDIFISYDCKQRHGSLDGSSYFDFANSLVPVLCFLWLRLAFSSLFS